MIRLVVLLVLVLASQVYCNDDILVNREDCPAMFVHTDMGCMCGFTRNEESWKQFLLKRYARCQLTENITYASVSSLMCMSYDKTTGISLASCPYNSCKQRAESQCTGEGVRFIKVPRDREKINDVICGEINRTGPLCSKCVEGLGPAVYYYGMPCVPCLGHLCGWLRYATLVIIFLHYSSSF